MRAMVVTQIQMIKIEIESKFIGRFEGTNFVQDADGRVKVIPDCLLTPNQRDVAACSPKLEALKAGDMIRSSDSVVISAELLVSISSAVTPPQNGQAAALAHMTRLLWAAVRVSGGSLTIPAGFRMPDLDECELKIKQAPTGELVINADAPDQRPAE